jgi:hypothetical protein
MRHESHLASPRLKGFLHAGTNIVQKDSGNRLIHVGIGAENLSVIGSRNRFELGSAFVEEKFPSDCPEIVICIAVVVVWVVVASRELSGCFGPEAQQMCKTVVEMEGGGPEALSEVYESLSIGFQVNRALRIEHMMKRSLYEGLGLGGEEFRGLG